MDISRASNFERFVYDLLDADAARVKHLWQQLGSEGQFDLSDHLGRFERDFGIVAGVSTHHNRLATIREVFDLTGTLIDPHTADGVKVARAYTEPGIPMLVIETALPAKFSETIEQALGRPAPRPPGFEDLEMRPQRVVELPCDVASVRDYIKEHART